MWLVVVWLVSVCSCDGDEMPDAGLDAGNDAATTVAVRILAINDFHGRLEVDVARTAGGAARIATLVAQLEEEQPNSVLVSAGDLVGGSQCLSASFSDEPTIAVMNAIGLDVAGVGNHEFDRPFDELQRLFSGGCPTGGCAGPDWEGAEFPLLGANVLDATTGEPLLPEYEVLEVGGIEIAFIGLTLEDTARIVNGPFVEGIRFADEVETVDALVPEIQARGIETIVVVMHQGSRGSVDNSLCIGVAGAALDIAAALHPAVDVVVSGHTHDAYVCGGGDAPLLTQAGDFGELITVIDLQIDPMTGDVVSSSAENRRVSGALDEDVDIRALIDGYAASCARCTNTVGTITADISNRVAVDGQKPAALLVADAFLAETASMGAVAAFTNWGGLRAPLVFEMSGDETTPGQVSFCELTDLIPFANNLVTLSLSGDQFDELLEQSATDDGGANFLQPSESVRYTWHQTADPTFGHVDPAEALIDGVALDPAGTYVIAVNSFMASGGSGSTVLAGIPATTGRADVDVVADYLAAQSPYDPPTADRITIVP